MPWPGTPEELVREQERLAALACEPWQPSRAPLLGACAVVSGPAGREDALWAAALLFSSGETMATATAAARTAEPFRAGRLALREGPVLEAAVRALARRPDVLLVAAAGRDHPLRAGLALHVGALLDLPTVGVTDRPLLATGEEPGAERGAVAPLRLGGEVVASWVRTRGGARPVVAHAAWRTSAETASEVVLESSRTGRWPEPIRAARRLARDMRARAAG
ncbi:MAG TPA: endonuclease V [Anaeromyxobacteraceae bacterium]|nr:endonuclease V [Anaeromyxobacteraceae bacterium]